MIRKTRIFLLIFVALVATVAGGAWRLKGLISPEAQDIKQKIQFDEKTGSINILALGVDDVEGVHRSDTIAFITLDIDNKRIKVMSLPRDTRTTIRDHGTQKINHSYAYGGVDLLKETVVNLIGMPIHYTLAVNYESFPKIVDSLGGIDVDVQKNLHYRDNAGGLYINIKKGWRHLDGKTSLEYVRFRHDALGDIGRIQRQQRFLKALLKKLYDPSTMSHLPEITEEILSVVETDIPPSQALQLIGYLKDISPERISFFTMPGKAAMINGASYWSPDLLQTSTLLTSSQDLSSAMNLSGQDEAKVGGVEDLVSEINRPIAILNGDGTSGLGKEISSRLEKHGIEVAYVGNAKHFDFHYSTINHKPGEDSKDVALALARLSGIPENLVKEDRGASYSATLILGHDKDRIIANLDR
ncbi:LCP family protein [Dethiosulfovibrio sp. F2B]|uniref:LCP family protein n=1 Tax=Dethiosulfovibrio faecalis TaxID=2720018 RepID=UPI001F2C3688|nr:LCP family protein [Dethiosulfovibrio faecalis]MCF4150515.1 LCP family protein [Dethiosulfovibrio faecalis]